MLNPGRSRHLRYSKSIHAIHWWNHLMQTATFHNYNCTLCFRRSNFWLGSTCSIDTFASNARLPLATDSGRWSLRIHCKWIHSEQHLGHQSNRCFYYRDGKISGAARSDVLDMPDLNRATEIRMRWRIFSGSEVSRFWD